MFTRSLISCLTVAALAAVPAAASASDPVLGSAVGPQHLTALDGTVVKVEGSGTSAQLIQRAPDGSVAPVAGAPHGDYRAIDLGHDATGALMITYIRCDGAGHCRAFSDDLHGRRVTFKHLTPKRCELTTAPARWGSRVAYGLSCSKLHGPPHVYDAGRSGLFVRSGAGAPKKLRAPKRGYAYANWADLRGTTVGAIAAGNQSIAYSQRVDGSRLRRMQITDNQGETDDYSIDGMELGGGGALWTLVTDSEEEGDMVTQELSSLGASACDMQVIPIVTDPNTHQPDLAGDALAVDGDTVYLTRGAAILTHAFQRTGGCF